MARSVRLLSLLFCYAFFVVLSFFSGRLVFAEETPAASAAVDAAPQTLEELKAAIEKVRVDAKLPGLGIALVDKNGPYWVAGLGKADMATHKPATEDTLFRIGSTSKMFVALSVLQLVEQGKLHLDDKLSDLAPELFFDNPWESTDPIRLVHLLEHTTGWDDVAFSVYSRQDATIKLKDALDFHPHYRKSRWAPGTRYAYNNAGPGVAAYIVSKITGQVFEDYVQEHFFNPLQMASTTFFESDAFKQLGATLYSDDGKAQPYWHIIVRPAGSINSSANDMAKYVQFLIARGSVNQQPLISEASFSRMETPTSTPGAKAGALAGYGLHNYVTGYESAGVAFRGHDGDVIGGHCRLSYIPELQSGYVLMVNQDNMQALDKIPKLIRAFLLKDVHKNLPKEIPLPQKFQQLSGYYIPIDARSKLSRLPTEVLGVIRFTVKDNHLHREPLIGGWEKPSDDYAVTENTLFNPWTGLPTIAVVQDREAGEVVEVTDGLTGSLFKRVSVVRAFGLLALIGVSMLLSASCILFAVIWGVRFARGKIAKGAAMSIRLWPLLTSIVLFMGLFAPSVFQPSLESMGTLSLTNVVIFLSSALFPVLCLFSLINSYRHRHASVNSVMYWHSVVVSLFQGGLAICLAYYGMFAIRMWA